MCFPDLGGGCTREPPMFPLKTPTALIALDGIADRRVSRSLVDWLSGRPIARLDQVKSRNRRPSTAPRCVLMYLCAQTAPPDVDLFRALPIR